jgi:hypothetical protein
MGRWQTILWAAVGAIAFAAAEPRPLSAAPCDEYDPSASVRSTDVVLTAGDFVNEGRDEVRTFVATGSLGRVDATIVSSLPRGVVRSFFAGPEISRYSPHYGEALKGIAVGVVLQPTRRPIRVVVRLRQVCAQYFRNSFLYH